MVVEVGVEEDFAPYAEIPELGAPQDRLEHGETRGTGITKTQRVKAGLLAVGT